MHAFRAIPVVSLLFVLNACASAGARRAPLAGAVAGIATLSADGRAVVGPTTADASLYKPENGAAVNVLAGVHLSDYFSVQGNYVWNRNVLTLSSIRSSDGVAAFFEERRESSQHAIIGDALFYFRGRQSWARPYLSAGVGVVRFQSNTPTVLAERGGLARAPAAFVSTDPALRVAVGIDLGAAAGWRFRYSFSETISRNPVSARLSPPAERRLANFQNLSGAVKAF